MSDAPRPDLPFDTIVTLDDEGRLSVAEFLALPLDRRIGLILERRLSFFLGDEAVDSSAAFQALMQQVRGRR